MDMWEIEEDQMIALIQEINRLGQSLLKFDEKEYSNYFSSKLAWITLTMLGIVETSPGPPAGGMSGDDGSTDNGTEGFDAGPYSYLFNSEVFLNENLLREIMAGIRQNSKGFYKTKAQTTQTGSSVVWKIEERQLMDLIQEIHRLGRVMGTLQGDAWSAYFSTTIPDIILKMLGIPETYSGIPYEDMHEIVRSRDDDDKTGTDEKPEKERAKHPAAYSRSFDYDMFNYNVGDERLKKFLDYTRKHRDEYRQIRAEQAKLGDKLYEPDAYDALYDKLNELVKSGKI
jgi:hypothetical protein